ncbi:DUF6660 family protein [Flavobacterium terrae]|uniref:DUF2946 domain-containing protein n=1 Tax=Flavobacterium terrae TaxID=415425 RepID=A0A1M6ETI6_9FLAO|nr:DUF6660 family protein [Flavobacterium terrae]SHI88679.1 hypothetical protein SAMN05444363_1943 [Flavobacterium terrae]
MKFISVILSFYIFVLSTVPCADIEINSIAHATVNHSSDKDNHSHNKSNDLCSPFCICNCCGQVTLTYAPVIIYDFQVQFEEIKTSNSFYTSVFHSNFYGSIWQPPQIV